MAVRTIGKYRVERLIKRGGMGAVYLGFDEDLKRPVAIKVLRDDLESDEDRERFRREAVATAALDHSNIIRVFEAGIDEGQPFIAMEYVAGESLAELIRRDATPLDRKLEIVQDVCSALGAAHRAGIVHRDIKPANILVAHDGTVKVVDFGIARTPDTTLTQLGTLVGTLDYMAPEQFSDRGVDARTDIFAVGVLLYELIAHRRPFHGEPQATLVARAQQRDPIALSDVCPGIDGDVAAIVAKALAHDPEDRYQDVLSLRAALTAARLRLCGAMDETLVSPRATALPPSTGNTGSGRQWRRPVAASAAGLALGLALVPGIDRWARAVPSEPPAAPPADSPWSAASLPPVVPAEVRVPSVEEPPVENPRPAAVSQTPARTVSPPPPAPVPEAPPPAPRPEPPAVPSIPRSVEIVRVPAESPSTEADASTATPRPAPAAPSVVTPAPVSVSAERQAVREVVLRYMQAMSDRNLVAMAQSRHLESEMRAAFEKQFRGLRSWKVSLVEPFIVVTQGAGVPSAMVTGRIHYEDVRSADGREGAVGDQKVTITLQKTPAGWQITDIR
jgi:serine/threonine-protein kinase